MDWARVTDWVRVRVRVRFRVRVRATVTATVFSALLKTNNQIDFRDRVRVKVRFFSALIKKVYKPALLFVLSVLRMFFLLSPFCFFVF
jgi:hypothetical protein